jgi:hypothetical protein
LFATCSGFFALVRSGWTASTLMRRRR